MNSAAVPERADAEMYSKKENDEAKASLILHDPAGSET